MLRCCTCAYARALRVVSADVTAGTALSRGLVKVGRAAPEREEEDGAQRPDRGRLRSPLSRTSAPPPLQTARNTRGRDPPPRLGATRRAARLSWKLESDFCWYSAGEEEGPTTHTPGGGRGGERGGGDLSTDGKRRVHLWPNALEIKKETKVGR